MAGKKGSGCGPVPRPLKDRLMEKVRVDPETGCWLYGEGRKERPSVLVRSSPRRVVTTVARASWMVHRGPIPDGLCVCHTCDTPRCINPDHLFLGTHADNVADKVAKGRQAAGERNGWAKLTWEEVDEIRTRYAAGGVTQYQLADEYGISQTNISDIIRGRMWSRQPKGDQ